MYLRRALLSLAFVGVLVSCKLRSASLVSASIDSAQVVFDLDHAISQVFKGVGVQWDPLDHDLGDYTEQDWALTKTRLGFARPSLIRVMVSPFYYFHQDKDTKKGIYIWEASEDQRKKLFSVQYDQVLRILELAKEWGSEVFFGQWSGLSKEYPYDSLESINRFLDFSEYLYSTKGFTNIRYLSFVNEPDGWWTYGDKDQPSSGKYWPQWTRAIKNLDTAMKKRSFASKVLLSGPACDIDFTWISETMRQYGSTFGAYDMHLYINDTKIDSGELEKSLANQKQEWSNSSPGEKEKPILLTEFGRLTGKNDEDQQTEIATFSHGLKMADFSVQMIRAGISGGVLYEVDDHAHMIENKWLENINNKVYKRWGFWSTVQSDGEEGRKSRPWFYPMSLLMRYFKRGAIIMKGRGVDLPGLRYIASQYGDAKKEIAVMIVNNFGVDRSISIEIPQLNQNTDLSIYEYRDTKNLFDPEGNPVKPEKILNQNLAQGVQISIPSKSVLFLTTEDQRLTTDSQPLSVAESKENPVNDQNKLKKMRP